MKHLMVIALLLLCAPAWGQPVPPRWEDFCPKKYCNAELQEEPELNRATHAVSAVLTGGLSAFYSLPKIKKARKIQEQNYWATRRTAFHNSLALCDQTQTDKALCYLQVTQIENQKTQAHRNEQELERIRRQIR